MFEAEADGLEALRRASLLRVPAPVAYGEDGGVAWLLMEHVAAGSPGRESLRALGIGLGLAEIHSSDVEGSFGWERDNWIGSLDQRNEASSDWGAFWRDVRIGPQLSAARRRGRVEDEVFDDVLEVIPGALADVETPELVHGDLWGGNWFADEEGRPVLIDPAVYRGHGEVDIAMSELFGGFGPAFYDAYADARAVTDAYDAYRRDLYQLYYLLVHVNLFGGAYEAGSRRAAERVVDALR
jgi:fructosamine-3-kinase